MGKFTMERQDAKTDHITLACHEHVAEMGRPPYRATPTPRVSMCFRIIRSELTFNRYWRFSPYTMTGERQNPYPH